jgi:glycogen debranching enzyme
MRWAFGLLVGCAGAQPVLTTGNAAFDRLYAQALAEAREASVDEIRDSAFAGGAPIDCGGCFETGELWTYVWTRDTAYATDLGLAVLDPSRARRSLEFKLSERRRGGGLEIVQDTGSGGSWPVSTDRVAWALGAAALLDVLDGPEREAFAARALDALANTIERDRKVVFDEHDGLYRGETSFLDWREQTYPPWTADDTLHIGTGKALSTNVLHLQALRLAARLAAERGDSARAERWRIWADALAPAIRARFWLPNEGLFSSYMLSWLGPAPVHRYDLLGSALAILFDVADPAQAQSVVARYPHLAFGPPVVWPEERDVPIYHNRAVWPFVTAYWIKAARKVGNAEAVMEGMESLVEGAARERSNMENFDAVTGRAEGPVINSRRQLWSVAGYLAMVHDVLFGIEIGPRGVTARPFVPRALRNGIFRNSDRLVLEGLRVRGRAWSVVVRLPPASDARTGAYALGRVSVEGSAIDVELLDRADAGERQTIRRVGPEDIYASGISAHHPRKPVLSGVPFEVPAGAAAFEARAPGPHEIQLLGENPGPINTGVTCAVRRVRVLPESGGAPVAEGYVFLPHGGHESSPLRVGLELGRRYRIVVDEDDVSVNMSAFAHFARYTGGPGGVEGARNTLELRALRVTAGLEE